MTISVSDAQKISSGEYKYLDGKIVRADSVPPKGLVLHERRDDAGRIIREWSGPKSAWMNEFKSKTFLQTVLSGQVEWNKNFHQQKLAEFAAQGIYRP